jgi:hypothetical protein
MAASFLAGGRRHAHLRVGTASIFMERFMSFISI